MLGRGRGFRGNVLDVHLDTPPGSTDSPTENNKPSSTVALGIGRGLLGRARPTPPVEPPSATSVVSTPPPQFGLGRGSNPQDSAPQDSGPVMPMGRGLGRGLLAPREPQIKELTERLQTVTISEGDRRPGDKEETTRPSRPRFEPLEVEKKHGFMGSKLALSANFIKLKSTQEFIYQYVVDFSPAIDSKALRFKLFNLIPVDHLGPLEARAFDGRILYLPRKLSQKDNLFQVKRPTDNVDIRVKISFTNEAPMVSCPAAYNVIFKRVQSTLRMVQVGRNYFNPDEAFHIPEKKLEIWPGYVTAIANYEGGLLLTVDVSHKVIRQDTVYDLIQEAFSQCKSQDDAKKRIIQSLIGSTVLTRYNNVSNVIHDFNFDMTPKDSFERNGQLVSFSKYYKEQYNIAITDNNQPLILSKVKKAKIPGKKRTTPETIEERYIMLVPELCYLTGITESMRTDMRSMRELHGVTRITPQRRYESLKKFISSIRKNERASSILRHWGLEIDMDTLTLDGRRFDPQSILFRDNQISAGPNADFKSYLKGQEVIEGIRCNQWLFLYPAKAQQTAAQFKKVLVEVAKQHGIDFSMPLEVKLTNDRTDSYAKALLSGITQDTAMVLTMFCIKREDTYCKVKQICYGQKGVASQCVVERTLSGQKMRSVAVNIALQMNVKLGGQLWLVKQPIKNLMVVGIDVYHEGRGSTRRSVGGIVGSLNPQCSKWFSNYCRQQKGQELIDVLGQAMVQNVREYYTYNNVLPATIIVFRDGVGDGRLTEVQQREIPQLRNALKVFKDYAPQLVFIVVSKRVNTRIFIKQHQQNSLDNPGPGTVLDHTVTKKSFYDFYLVPQSVRQGTVTPTHFNVLFDSSCLDPDKVQMMTFKMCHLYYNWPGTVRVPAPCLYAHKVAYMHGQYVIDQPQDYLKRTLYYL